MSHLAYNGTSLPSTWQVTQGYPLGVGPFAAQAPESCGWFCYTFDLWQPSPGITIIAMPIGDGSCPNLTQIPERTPAAVQAGFLLFHGINV